MRMHRITVAAVVLGLGALALAGTKEAAGQVVVGRPVEDSRPLVRIWSPGSEIGVSIRDVDQADVEREKLESQAGAVVEEVRSDGPAAEAGVKAGDVIVEFDAERVRSARQLSRLAQETPDGRTVRMAVRRAGQRVDLKLTPRRRASGLAWLDDEARRRDLERLGRDLRRGMEGLRDFDLRGFRGPVEVPASPGRFGVTVQSLTPQLAGYFGVEQGVLVSSVQEESVAAKAGVQAGDVITAINGAAVDNPRELGRRIGRIADGDTFEIALVRDKQATTLQGTMEERAERRRPA